MSTKPSEGAVKAADDYDALKSDLARVTAERDHWIALYKERNKTAAILEDTSIALRARVADLQQQLDNLTASVNTNGK